MKIAVTYENGLVFQHFGKTESFKLFETENGKVLSCEVIGTDGNGHEALADFLADKDVDVVICGGLGEGAKDALSDAGIEVVSGVKGGADEAVAAYLKGDLVSEGVNCDHHDHDADDCCHDDECDCGCGCEEDDCGCGCGDDECGGGCGGCGGCHSMPPIEGPNSGLPVKVHYRGTLDDGTQFDSSYDRGEPLEFICGAGQMIRGFDEAVAVMEVGQIVNVHLTPDKAYGYVNPNAIFTVELKNLSGAENLEAGEHVTLYNSMGHPIPVTVVGKDDTTITFDANHELAGKELNFQIELVEVE